MAAKIALSHPLIYAIGNISRQLSGFLMLPVYTRFLSPSDYGVISLILFFLSLVELLFGARLAQSIPKFYYSYSKLSDKNAVISTALITTFMVSVVGTALFASNSNAISQAIGSTDRYESVVAIFSVLLLTQAIEFYGTQFLRIQQRPIAFVVVGVTKLVTQLFLNLIFVVVLEMGIYGVALSSALSSSVFAIILAIYTLRKTGAKYNPSIAVRQVQFCWPLWVGAFSGIYIASSSRFFTKIFSTLDDVGLYEIAAKFSSILLLLVWDPFAQYWNIERFSIYKDQDSGIDYFRVAFKILVALLAVVGVGISVFSPQIIYVMADHAFHSSYAAVPPLVGYVFFTSLAGFCDFPFMEQGKTSALTKISYLGSAAVTIFYWVLVPKYGFLGAAYGLMLAGILQFALTFHVGRLLIDMRLDLRFLVSVIVLSVVTQTLCASVYDPCHPIRSTGLQFLIYIIFTLTILIIFLSYRKSLAAARKRLEKWR
jgi:O-antigen/teichoic acid export membrane protein